MRINNPIKYKQILELRKQAKKLVDKQEYTKVFELKEQIDNIFKEIRVNNPSIGKYKIKYSGTMGGYIKDEIKKLNGKITSGDFHILNKEGILFFDLLSPLLPKLQKVLDHWGIKIEKQ